MVHKNLTLSGDGESEYIGYFDRQRIVKALMLAAKRLTTDAKAHKWQGDAFSVNREEMRSEAKALRALAERIGYPEE